MKARVRTAMNKFELGLLSDLEKFWYQMDLCLLFVEPSTQAGENVHMAGCRKLPSS